jgi:hypothetical protein
VVGSQHEDLLHPVVSQTHSTLLLALSQQRRKEGQRQVLDEVRKKLLEGYREDLKY